MDRANVALIAEIALRQGNIFKLKDLQASLQLRTRIFYVGGLTGMGRYSYIRKQIENCRATLTQIEEQAGVSPEDEGLKELKQIFANRITSLEMIFKEEDRGTAAEHPPSGRRFRDAA
ncbi:MAG TPA: hypothetical protein VN753_01495 [Terracidiphilus sp.]|nr:hypothetical protein [Terracidiphilus sp.]